MPLSEAALPPLTNWRKHVSISALEAQISTGEMPMQVSLPRDLATHQIWSTLNNNAGVSPETILQEYVSKRIPYAGVQVLRDEERVVMELCLDPEALQNPATFAQAFLKFNEGNQSADLVASQLTEADWREAKRQCHDPEKFTSVAGELHMHVLLRAMIGKYKQAGGSMDMLEGDLSDNFHIDNKLLIRCVGQHNWELKHEGCPPVEIDSAIAMNETPDRIFIFDACTSARQVEQKLQRLKKLGQHSKLLDTQKLGKITLEKFHVAHDGHAGFYEYRDGYHLLTVPSLTEVIRLKHALIKSIKGDRTDLMEALKHIP